VRKNLTGNLPILRKRRSALARRVPVVGWGFDSQPDDLDPLAKRFVLRLDTPKILPDVLLSLLDNINSTRDHIKSTQDNIKSMRDNIKSTRDILLSLRDHIKSTRDNIKSSRDHIKITQDNIKIQTRQLLFMPGNREIQPDHLVVRVADLNSEARANAPHQTGL
jgi:septal ring factor EnvC (AmiA/AmiB activator)